MKRLLIIVLFFFLAACSDNPLARWSEGDSVCTKLSKELGVVMDVSTFLPAEYEVRFYDGAGYYDQWFMESELSGYWECN